MPDRPTPDESTADRPESSRTRPLSRRLQDRLRVFNKHVLNPLTLRFAGRPHVPYGAVRHVGRRSGRVYDTPVLVRTTDDRVLVPLPYGADVDWCRNVRAADGCTVAWQGRAYRAGSPRLVGLDAGRAAFPGWVRLLLRTVRTEQVLELDRGEAAPGRYRAIAGDHPARPVVIAVVVLVLLAVLLWWAVGR